MASSITRHIQTFSEYGGLICGRRGAMIKTLQEKFGLKYAFLQRGEETTSTLQLTGPKPSVEAAESWITKKYPVAFLSNNNILPMVDAREIFLRRRLQRKLNQTQTPCTPIVKPSNFPMKEKKPSAPRTFVFDKYIW